MQTQKLTKWVSCIMLTMGLLVAACTNEEEVTTNTASSVQQVKKSEVVNILQNMDINNIVVQEIHDYVCKNMASGRDEYVRVGDILSEQTRNGSWSNFACCLKQMITEGNITHDTDVAGLLEALTNSDIIIYWPYSEDWDGKELPTLVAAPEDQDAKEAYGTKLIRINDAMTSEKVLVNEEYAMQHPVWVINTKKEEPNVVYIPTSEEKAENSNTQMTTRATGDPIYVWRMTRMKVTHQYDGLFKGGAEMDVQVVFPLLPGYAAVTTKQRVNFSRKDIRKERWKDLDILLNTNWREEQITNALVITEWDNGKPFTIKASATYRNEDGSEVTSSIDLTITDDDDIICQQPIDRAYAFQHNNYSFDGGRVSIVTSITVEYEQ